MSHYPGVEVYSCFSLLAFLLFIIPSLCAWHLEARNTALLCASVWGAIGSLNFFINSVVWNGRVDNFAPVWCDISSKIQIGMNVAFHACSLSMNRRLYYIAKGDIAVTSVEKRRTIMVDLSICVGIPVLHMILNYISQEYRFDILEDFGCFPSDDTTWVSYFLLVPWPLVIVLVSSVYSILNLKAFNQYRKRFKEHLSQVNGLNPNFYLRLMCLTGTDIVLTIPLSVWFAATNSVDFVPWISWEETHHNFSRIQFVPAPLWEFDSDQVMALESTRWSVVMCGFLFFGFFGFTTEARKAYRTLFSHIWRRSFGHKMSNEAMEPDLVFDFAPFQSQHSTIPQSGAVPVEV
ncbi:hypothetical protein E1B28_003490 [Marasmius oreades]|uniref:Pheromone receptor n=1 Tax=Marasmius oreades TaxID=181124 RepID=A0A9P7RM30_9AGAR|nr:uncharacterized protein E1B28_003490 [Marasmius oreades]KAG7085965.1 hypothetical protein E1B28_003490 [Marasmius oreades]